jgi:hypothetical protein
MFRLTCQLDLEGIVAKRANSPHLIKIKNPAYSQKEGRTPPRDSAFPEQGGRDAALTVRPWSCSVYGV